MKNQTLSIEQMKRLKEMGVDTSKASMYWEMPTIPDYKSKLNIVGINGNLKSAEERNIVIGAFTLQDMLKLLPKLIVKNKLFLDIRPNVIYSNLCVSYMDVNTNETIITFCSDKIIDAAYQTLCWCAENGYLKGGKP